MSLCPFMNNSLYLLLCDWLDDSKLRPRTIGFVRQHFGRGIRACQLGEFMPYLSFGLYCVLWLNAVLSITHRAVTALSGGAGAPKMVAAITLGIPVMLIAASVIAWGVRILTESLQRYTASPSDTNTIIFELVGLGLFTVLTFALPGTARKVFSLNMLFLTLLAFIYFFLNALPFYLATRAAPRFLAFGLFAQILWIPVLSLFCQTTAAMHLPVPWVTLVLFIATAAVYFVLSVCILDFLNKGPVLEIAEGLVWLSVPVLLISVAELLRLGRALEDVSDHPLTLFGLVLGGGLLFLGLFVPAQFLRKARIVSQPYPFSTSGDSNRAKLWQAFQYYHSTLSDTVLTAFGPKCSKLIRDACRGTSSQTAGHGESTPGNPMDTADIRESEYGPFVRSVSRSLSSYCGEKYVELLTDNIMEAIHWDARRLLLPLVSPDTDTSLTPVLGQQSRLELLQSVHVLRGVDADSLGRLASCMELANYELGHVVVDPDDLCDSLYVIVAGVGQSEEWDVAGETVVGAYLRRGDAFGEAALLPGEPAPHRFAIRASSPLVVGRIQDTDFGEFCRTFPQVGAEVRENVRSMQLLQDTKVFKELSPALVSFVLARVQYEQHRAGDAVMEEGESGTRFYMIMRGAAEAIIHRDGTERKVGDLGTGDYFGEIALLMDVPRTATVRAVTDLDVGFIEKSDFLSLRGGSRGLDDDLQAVARERVESQKID